MRSAPAILLMMGLLMSSCATGLGAPAAGREQGEARAPVRDSTGDWTVTDARSRSDETLVLSGNLTISGPGSLRLSNVTLKLNCTSHGQYGIRVKDGGELALDAGCSILRGAAPVNYTFSVDGGSRLWVNDSSVSNCGFLDPAQGEWSPGLLVSSSSAWFRRANLTSNYAALNAVSSVVQLDRVRVAGNVHGLAFNDSSPGIVDSNLSNAPSGGADLRLLRSSAELVNSTLRWGSVKFLDASSRMNVSWRVRVRTIFLNGTPAPGVNLTFQNSTGAESLRAVSDQAGRADVVLRELWSSSRGVEWDSPYLLHSEWRGVSRNTSSPLKVNGSVEVVQGVDAVAPKLAIITPAGFANSTLVEVRGTASDDGGLVSVEVEVDGGGWLLALQRGPSWSEWNRSFELAPGWHLARARALDGAGLCSSAEAVFLVDTGAPNLTLSEPRQGFLTNLSTIDVAGRTDPDAAVKVNGQDVTVGADGAFRATAVLAPGTNRLVVRARDPAGNERSVTVSGISDPVPPELSAFASNNLTNLSTVTIFGESEPDAEVRVGGSPVALDEYSTFRVSISLSPGLNSLEVTAADRAGNQMRVLVEVVRDDVAPSVSILRPADGEVVASARLEVCGTASDEHGINSVIMGLDDANFIKCNGTTSWRGSLNLTEGEHSINIVCYDRAANAARLTRRVTYRPVVPDTAAPVVTVRTPATDRVAKRLVVVSGNVSDPSGVRSVEVSLDGANWLNCSLSGNGTSWSREVELGPGRNVLRIRSSDGLGNSGSRSITIDVVPAAPSQGPNWGLLAGIIVAVAAAEVAGSLAYNRWRRGPDKPEPRLGEEEALLDFPMKGLKG